MANFNVIKKGTKFYVTNDFFGDMMIYKANTNEPYIKRLGLTFVLEPEMIKELRVLQSR